MKRHIAPTVALMVISALLGGALACAVAAVFADGKTEGRTEAFESLDFHGCRVDRS